MRLVQIHAIRQRLASSIPRTTRLASTPYLRPMTKSAPWTGATR